MQTIVEFSGGGASANSSLKGFSLKKCCSQTKKLAAACFSAFTLAEVLITLGIIGIIAAMTLPSVMGRYQEKATISKLKKMNTILNQAFLMAVEKNGTPDVWGFTSSSNPSSPQEDYRSRNLVLDMFLPYLKVVSVCRYGDSCQTNPKFRRNRYSLDGTLFGSFGTPLAVLADGSSIDIIYMSYPSCDGKIGPSKHLQAVCGEIFVDLNGIKPPNATGKDVFWFRITKYGIYPGGESGENARSFESYCNLGRPSSVNGYGCTEWVLYNENLDYLRCNDLSWKTKSKCSR